MWAEVNSLLREMGEHGLPLQESILISVINVCRISARRNSRDSHSHSNSNSNSNSFSGNSNSSFAHYSYPYPQEYQHTGDWAHAVALVNEWANKTENVSESVYTMAMDVCESANRHDKIIELFQSMITSKVRPSKSSYMFALRACTHERNVPEAVRILNEAEKLGFDSSFMYNATLMLCETTGQYELAVSIMKTMLVNQNKEPSSSYSTNRFLASLKSSKWRNSILWTARRVISKSLDSLTRNFSSIFTEVKDGRLAPSADARKFVHDLTDVLSDSIHQRFGGLQLTLSNQVSSQGYLTPSCYPMANKLLLDKGDFEALRILLNSTLQHNAINSTRLYDFAFKSLIPFSRVNVDQLRSNVAWCVHLMDDAVQAGDSKLASSLLAHGMIRLRSIQNVHTDTQKNQNQREQREQRDQRDQKDNLSPPGSDIDSKDNKDNKDSKDSKSYYERKKRDRADTYVIERKAIIHELFLDARDILPLDSIPQKCYQLASIACKESNSPDRMLELYRLSLEDGRADASLRNQVLFSLARSEHWALALELFDEMRKQMKEEQKEQNGQGVGAQRADAYLYNSALVACERGKDYEEAIHLLDQMVKDGLRINTVAVTTAIATCAAAGKPDQAISLLKMMVNTGIRRNAVTYTAAISACSKTGRWKDALSIYEMVQQEENLSAYETESESKGGNDNNDSEATDTEKMELSIEREEEEEDAEEEEEEEEEEIDDDEYEDEDDDDDEDDGIFSSSEAYSYPNNAGGERGEKDVAMNVLYNALIECLGEGHQTMLVDDLYKEALKRRAVTPFKLLEKKNWIDLHDHSAHMARAAMRKAFQQLVKDYETGSGYHSNRNNGNGSISNGSNSKNKNKDIVVIVGKGERLQAAIEEQLLHEFKPSIRAYRFEKNMGRLLLPERDVIAYCKAYANNSRRT